MRGSILRPEHMHHRHRSRDREEQPTQPQVSTPPTTLLARANPPFESPKRSPSLRTIAHLPITHPPAQEHRQRDEPREPEQHRQRLRAQNRELVVRDCVGEAPGHDDEVGEGEEGPYGAELPEERIKLVYVSQADT